MKAAVASSVQAGSSIRSSPCGAPPGCAGGEGYDNGTGPEGVRR
jgi:hypothetical protein